MKKNIIIITGGAGFVGSNLIKCLLDKTKYKLISIDNYSSGNKNNHLKNFSRFGTALAQVRIPTCVQPGVLTNDWLDSSTMST